MRPLPWQLPGPRLAGRRYSVPFFALLSFCVVVLTLKTTALHHLFYLLPRFQVIHEHEPQRILVVLNIGPAILVGAAVSAIQQRVARPRQLIRAAIAVPLMAVLFIILAERAGRSLGSSLLIASIVTAVLLAGCAAAPWLFSRRLWSTWATSAMAAVLVLFLAANLDGGKLSEGYANGFGSQGLNDLTYTYADDADADGTGGFLRERQAEGEYFRYFGYNPRYLSGDEDFLDDNYRSQWPEEFSAELLVNNRSLTLGLQDIQGYDPVYYMDYLRFIDAINWAAAGSTTENNVLPSGLNSPLLRLLNVRYVVVPDVTPAPDSDLAMLNERYREVFRNGEVRVLEVTDALPRAWVVHEARQEQDESILPLLAGGMIDPRQTALTTDPAPALETLSSGARDEVGITQYEPDQITLSTSLGASGLLVLSEVYDPGWDVLIDGRRADLLKVDGHLRGVVVPAGAHEVVFRYSPTVLQAGTAITGGTLGIFLLGTVGLRLREPLKTASLIVVSAASLIPEDRVTRESNAIRRLGRRTAHRRLRHSPRWPALGRCDRAAGRVERCRIHPAIHRLSGRGSVRGGTSSRRRTGHRRIDRTGCTRGRARVGNPVLTWAKFSHPRPPIHSDH